MTFKPSKYQVDIYDFIEKGEGNAVIRAVAGSGKTTTIIEGLKLIPKNKKALFCAFNKAIAEELGKKVPKGVETSTIHSLGYAAIRDSIQPTPQMTPDKFRFFFEQLIHITDYKLKYQYLMAVQKVTELMRMNLEFDYDKVRELCYKHSIPIYGMYERDIIVDASLILSFMVDDVSTVDFTDMVFFPAVMDDIELPQYDFVFVDECQDLNRAQQEVLRRVLKPDGRFIAVGDDKQSIYGFAGADIESFERLLNKPNTKLLPLSVCYRCGKAIVEKAKKIVPYIEPFESAIHGVVRHGYTNEIKDGDWVLCRNVKPLVELCVILIDKGFKAVIKGKDIGKSIINLLKRTGEDSTVDAIDAINEMILKCKSDLKKNGVKNADGHPQVVDMIERRDIVNFLGKGRTSVEGVLDVLKDIFKDDQKDGILLSTIHKAKGLENDRIFFYLPELIPSQYAVKSWQIQQELNLTYVAYTRAKKELVIVRNAEGGIEGSEAEYIEHMQKMKFNEA